MKQKSKKLIILFIISLVMILGFATMVNAATLSLSKTTLELEVGKTENLTCTGAESITWTSSDETIATVNSTGLVTAIKEGTTTITATAGEETATCTVNVTTTTSTGEEENVQWTDFTNAEMKLEISSNEVILDISNIKTTSKSTYYYCITSDNKKPEVKTSRGTVDNFDDESWDLFEKRNDGCIRGRIEKYVELNQDLYLWIIESVRLENAYIDENNEQCFYKSSYVVTGEKLTRPQLVYAEMIDSGSHLTKENDYFGFNIPATGKRSFVLKIGKITDNNILNGIKNNKGEAWNDLLEYAKKSESVYNNRLSTNNVLIYNSDDSGQEVIKLNNLENDKYYYLYVVFDDENGKYYPASGLTIAKANVHKDGSWYMWLVGSNEFKWDDFGVTQTEISTIDSNAKQTSKSTTTATTTKKTNNPKTLPYTGATTLGLVIVAMVGTAVFFKVRNDKYKGI